MIKENSNSVKSDDVKMTKEDSDRIRSIKGILLKYVILLNNYRDYILDYSRLILKDGSQLKSFRNLAFGLMDNSMYIFDAFNRTVFDSPSITLKIADVIDKKAPNNTDGSISWTRQHNAQEMSNVAEILAYLLWGRPTSFSWTSSARQAVIARYIFDLIRNPKQDIRHPGGTPDTRKAMEVLLSTLGESPSIDPKETTIIYQTIFKLNCLKHDDDYIMPINPK